VKPKLEVHTLQEESRIGTECAQHQWLHHVEGYYVRTLESGNISTGARMFTVERTFEKLIITDKHGNIGKF